MKKNLILLFLIAFAVRVIFCLSYNIYELYPDAMGYHMYAVNLIDKDYYSPLQSPTEDIFFREPVAIYVLKIAYQVASLLDINAFPISNYSMIEYAVSDYHPEFYWGRLMFAFIDSISICFFFLTLLYFTTQKKALIISAIYLLFLPCFFYLQTLLRDSFQVSLLLILNYFFIRYLFKGSRISLLIVGILLGIAILTLKALAVIGLGIVIYIYIVHRKSLKTFFMDTALVTIISCLTITPWMIKVYESYPDIRTLKSLGTSFTSDMGEFCTAMRVFRYAGRISVDDSERILVETWSMDSKKQFALSFDKTFKQQTDSIYALMGDKKARYRKKFSLYSYRRALENSLYPTGWGLLNPSISKANEFLSPLFISIGMLGFLGLILFFRTYWKGLMTYLSLMVTIILLPSFGDEGRRLLIFYSIWIPFSLLLVNRLVYYYKRKMQ